MSLIATAPLAAVPAIEVRDLHFSYPYSSAKIFAGLNWTVQQQEFWVLIGENGCGKSSLIRLLLGLEQAQQGRILIQGQSNGPAAQHKPAIGYVPQYLQFDKRLPIPVLEVVEGGTLSHSFFQGLRCGHKRSERIRLSKEALAQVGLLPLSKQPFSQLSGGQRQRVLIARALATQSPILVLDEPTASVDPTAAREIVQICQKLRSQHTIIFVSHDIGTIPDGCDHIICMDLAAGSSRERTTLAEQQTSKAGFVEGQKTAQKTDDDAKKRKPHTHFVKGMSRHEILLLLYNHWGLNYQTGESKQEATKQEPCESKETVE